MKKFTTFLIEEDGRIDPDTYNLSALYDGLNAKLFNRELPDIPVSFGEAPKGSHGVTRFQVTRPARAPKSARQTVPGSIRMVINARPWRMDMFYGLVAHEMIHVWCAATNHHEANSHGMWFQMKRAQLEPKAGFPIPAKDAAGDEQENAHEELPVFFIAGKNRSGRENIALFGPKTVNDARQVHNAEVHCKVLVERGWQYAMYGTATTTLADRAPVHRSMKDLLHKITFYVVPIAELKNMRVMGSQGKLQ